MVGVELVLGFPTVEPRTGVIIFTAACWGGVVGTVSCCVEDKRCNVGVVLVAHEATSPAS